MKILTISPFNQPEESYFGIESTITGDPATYTNTSGDFLDDLIALVLFCKRNNVKLKPVELNFELE